MPDLQADLIKSMALAAVPGNFLILFEAQAESQDSWKSKTEPPLTSAGLHSAK